MENKGKALAIGSLALFISSCSAPSIYREAFDKAMKSGNIDEAYSIVVDVCEKTPLDKICVDSAVVKKAYAEKRLLKLKATLDSEKRPIPIKTLQDFEKELSRINSIHEVNSGPVIDAVSREKKTTNELYSTFLNDSKKYFDSGQFAESFEAAKQAFALDESARPFLDDIAGKGLEKAYGEGAKAASEEDWTDAHRFFKAAAHIDPAYKDIKARLDEAAQKDSFGFHDAESGRAEEAGEYERAVKLRKYSLKYKDDGAARALYADTAVRAVKARFDEGVSLMSSGQPLTAGFSFIKAISGYGALPAGKAGEITPPSKEIARLLDELNVKGAKHRDSGNKELAWLHFHAVSAIQPDYPDIISQRERLREEIKRQATRSLAVIPFKGPSYNTDAGSAVTSSVLDTLYRELSNEVRILERSAIEALLKESEVKTLQGERDARGVLQLLGADYLILGDVVDYKAESAVAEVHKTVRAKTGMKKVTNPVYEEWTRTRTGTEPPRTVEEPVFEDIKYRMTHYRKTGIITVSYRVVDSKGFVIHTRVAEKRVEAEDEGTEGIEIGEFKVPAKIARLQTDTEILRSVQSEVVKGISAEVKDIFSNGQEKLVKEAQALYKAGNTVGAIEKTVQVIFLSEGKGKAVKDIEGRVTALIKEAKL